MADQPRNVRDADEDAKPQPGAKPANDPPAKPAADTPEPKPTEEDSQAEPKPTEEDSQAEPKPTEEVKLEDPRIADLQAKLAAATAQACAVRALAEAGLPVNLADLVTGGAPEDITANVEALAQAIDAAASQRNAPAQPSLPPDAEEPEEDMRARARRIFA